ncbi:MAG: tetratricopeptide repeat protein [Acidobacteriota bacterium]|nr:tetratricopeptide repeat protein [Acidobacteriota bacterium]
MACSTSIGLLPPAGVTDLRARAEAGVPGAQFTLGDMHATGRGVPQDDTQAVYWYRLAADQGLPEAQFTLGVMYAEGRGVSQDTAEAAHWYHLAAAQGYPREP